MQADESAARRFLEQQPDLVRALTTEERRLVHAVAKQGRADALRLMGDLGFDLAVTGDDGETALHIAAWHGRAEAVRALVQASVPLDLRENRFQAVPLGWCVHGSLYCKGSVGDYPAVAETLLKAGAIPVPAEYASPEIQAVFKRFPG